MFYTVRIPVLNIKFKIFNGDYSVFNDIDNEDLSTTEDFDIDDILRLGTTPQPFDIFQTTGPIIDEIRLWTTGPDYPFRS